MSTLLPRERFKLRRAEQLSAYLQRVEGATRFSIGKFCNILYLLEIQSYGEFGMPLTYDRAISTETGPTLVMVPHVLMRSPSTSENLSEFSLEEIEMIEFMVSLYGSMTDEELDREVMSRPEWNSKGGSEPIWLEDILKSVGVPDDQIMPRVANILATVA